MRIAIVTPVLSYRGGERIFYTLAKGLVAKGNKVDFFVGKKESTAFSLSSIPIFLPHAIVQQLMKNNLLFLFFYIPIMLLLLAKHVSSTDLIMTESGLSLWVGIIASWITKKPIVWMIFAYEQHPFQNPIASFFYIYFYQPLDKWFARQAKASICIAPRVKRIVEELYGVGPIIDLLPAVDTNRFIHANASRVIKKYNLKGKKIILLPATLHPKKNQEIAILAMEKVIKKIPNAILLLIGEGGDRGRLEKLVEKHHLSKYVVFGGVARNDSIADFYHVADVVLCCSNVENEGLSMISLEALSTGVLPIVAKGAGVAEVLKEKKIGIIVQATPPSFAKAIIDCLQGMRKYHTMIQKGKQWIRKDFSVNSYAEKLLVVFNNVLYGQKNSLY